MKNEINRTLLVKKNQKIFLIAIACLLATNLFAQKTYTYDDGVALATDWTVVDNTATVGGTAKCEIAAAGKFSAKNGNYLLFSFENKSGISITITSTASFNNISNITFDVVGNDNSKPDYTLNIVDDSGNVVQNIYSNKTSKTDFNTGGTNKWGVSNSDISPVKSGHIQLVLTASSSGKYTAIDNLAVTYQAGPPPASTDATLSSLTYNGTSVPNFDPNTTTYDVELPTGTTAVPTVVATKNDSKASDPVINAAMSLPGATTVTVTAEDGTTTKTYTINFSVASAYPKVLTATWTNIAGQPVIDQNSNPKTITGKVAQGTGLTAITPSFTGNNIASWTPEGAQNFSNGAVEYTFSAQTGEVTVYNVTITEVPVVHPTSVSLDKSSLNLQIGGSADLHATVLPADATDPSVSWTSNNTSVVNVNNNGHVTAVAAGTTTITVTTTDGNKTATCTVTVTAGPPVPHTTLTTHVPEIYEAKEIAGGYNTPLTVVAGREYEVFYINRVNSSDLTVATSNADKAGNICDDSSTSNTARAKDGWLTIKCNGTGGDTGAGAKDEFQGSIRSAKLTGTSHVMEMHIQGYDQFSFYGNDNNQDASKNKMFEVYIDDVKQTRTPRAYSINRFDITSGEHVIRITGSSGNGDNKLCSFSLRVAQEPRVKREKGNDSAQVVLATTAIQPIVYSTKYNNISGAETRLTWIGAQPAGIDTTMRLGELKDTIIIGGIANCEAGEYNYEIAAYYNDVKKNSLTGKFFVKTDIKSITSTNATVYQNEEMDQIEFKYYALSAENVILTWTGGTTPVGITGNGNNGTYLIGGTPTQTGEYTYSITVQGADTTITGKIIVRELDYGTNPVLYLYKNENAYESDGVRNYLKNNGWNPIERKAKKDGLRPANQYEVYKLVVISEDVDANNLEVQQIIQNNGASLPVLNLKGFTYAKGEGLLGWGEPSNGAIDSTKNTKSKGTKIKIQHANHPIFAKLGNSAQEGSEISILSNYALQGVMPIAIDMQYITDQTLCMGTAPIRANTVDGYYEEGAWEAAIHEILPAARGGQKYICLPLARSVTLTTSGERLIEGIVNYLVSTTPTTISAPDLLITGFSVKDSKNNEYAATIDQTEHTITLRLTPEEYQALDSLKEAKPIITHPNFTSVSPASGEEVKLTYAYLRPQKYIITDFINKNVYNFILELYNPHQGIEEAYEAGQWVNIFDIYGRKVATTNEDIYSMELPHGMYIIMTESGKTLKIMK